MLPGHLVVTRGQGKALGMCGAGSSLRSVGIPVLGSRAVMAGAGEELSAPTRPGLSPGRGCALAQQPCHNSRATCCGSTQQQQAFAGTIRTHHLATPWCWGLEPSSVLLLGSVPSHGKALDNHTLKPCLPCMGCVGGAASRWQGEGLTLISHSFSFLHHSWVSQHILTLHTLPKEAPSP